MAELWTMTATQLAATIARGEISAFEAVDAHVSRILHVNPRINALVAERYDAAYEEAREADRVRAKNPGALGPLHGVPVSIKESIDVAGMASTFGLPARAKDRAIADDPRVARLRAAGAIVLGKTNLSQLTIFIESDNPLYGRTDNPWNLGRTPGGSSGGEAALIAAGGAPLGVGTDIGGSIRVPATFCGIYGLKPTQGRLNDAARLPVFTGQKAIESQLGPFARSVDDLALALELLNGGRAGIGDLPMPLGDRAAVDVRALRVGYYETLGSFAPAPAVARAVRETAQLLGELGATVTPFKVPHVETASDLFYGIMSADGGAGAIQVLGDDERDPRVENLFSTASKPRALLAPVQRLLQLAGQNGLVEIVRNFGFTDTHHYWKLVEGQEAYRKIFAHELDTAEGGPFDLLLGPACGLPAIVHGASRDLSTAGAYASLYNVLGYPTGIVPVTRVRADEELGRRPSRDRVQQAAYRSERGSAGLPVGVQVIARPWREHVALAAMAALEPLLRERAEYPVTPVVSM